MPAKIRLFIKPGCPWCMQAEEWLQEHEIDYQQLDVVNDRAAAEEMFRLSRQTKAPTIDVDGKILADFDTGQLTEFWKQFKQGAHGE